MGIALGTGIRFAEMGFEMSREETLKKRHGVEGGPNTIPFSKRRCRHHHRRSSA